MNYYLTPLHRLIGGVDEFVMASTAGAVLLLAIIYLTFSKAQRPRRLPMLVCASVAGILVVITEVNLKLLATARDTWAKGTDASTPIPTFSMLGVTPACVAVGVVIALCLNTTVGVWRNSHWAVRTTLVSGSLTLIGANLSVAAACIGYIRTPDSVPAFITNWSTYARDLSVGAGIVFSSILIVFAADILVAMATKRTHTNAGGGSET